MDRLGLSGRDVFEIVLAMMLAVGIGLIVGTVSVVAGVGSVLVVAALVGLAFSVAQERGGG